MPVRFKCLEPGGGEFELTDEQVADLRPPHYAEWSIYGKIRKALPPEPKPYRPKVGDLVQYRFGGDDGTWSRDSYEYRGKVDDRHILRSPITGHYYTVREVRPVQGTVWVSTGQVWR